MAEYIYLTIVGSKQGKFRGSSHGKSWASHIIDVSFGFAVNAPRDTATGMASWKTAA